MCLGCLTGFYPLDIEGENSDNRQTILQNFNELAERNLSINVNGYPIQCDIEPKADEEDIDEEDEEDAEPKKLHINTIKKNYYTWISENRNYKVAPYKQKEIENYIEANYVDYYIKEDGGYNKKNEQRR